VYAITSNIFQHISQKDIIWKINTSNKEIFLTFDDGPVERVTDFVLEELSKYNAKATFFCVGDNVRKHTNIYQKIIEQNHSVGNHTFHHLNGWNYSLHSYIANVKMSDVLLKTKLFRPPYGKITPLQRKELQKDYYVILWSVIPGDFDKKISKEKCLERAIDNSDNPGSIIVFHDSYKAEEKIRFVLPNFLKHFNDLGYTFSAITPELCEKEIKAI